MTSRAASFSLRLSGHPLVAAFAASSLLLVAHPALAGAVSVGNLDSADHHAWSETSGYLSARPSHGGVTVHASHLSGYAWSEGLGYVKLGSDGGGPYANTTSSDWGVNRDAGGNLSGYGWSETSGWIRFDPTHGGVTIDPATGDFAGYAWSEGVGFVHFASAAPTAYATRFVFPGNPTVLAATAPHVPEEWSTETTVEMEWSGASDNGVGLGGYSVVFDDAADTLPDAGIDVVHEVVDPQGTSEALADGTEHWFHLRACDTVGNCAPTALHRGPYWVDGTPPQVALVHTVADTGDGALAPDEATRAAITQFLVSFDEEVRDPAGDEDAEDVTNPASWRLIGPGVDGAFETVDCAGGVAGTDEAFGIDAVTYDAGNSTATLSLAGGEVLPRGRYRLLVCSPGRILDVAGHALDGAGDGTGGDDHTRAFAVSVDQLLGNPNFDVDLAGWSDMTPGNSNFNWTVDDAGEVASSGSAEVLNVDGTGDVDVELAADCVELTVETGLHQSGALRVSGAVGDDPVAWSSLAFFSEASCTGTPLGPEIAALHAGGTAGGWPRPGGWVAVPAGALSVRASFGATAGDAATFNVSWDSVSLFDMLFGDGFESGTTAGWTWASP